MSKKIIEGSIRITNVIASIVVGISVIAIIVAAIFILQPNKITENKVVVEYKIEVDSLNFITPSDTLKIQLSDTVDVKSLKSNNQKIYDQVNRLFKKFDENHMENENAEKSQTNFITFSSAIFALIVSITGFFGFKSIKEMKLKAIESAEEQAKAFLREKSIEMDKNFKNDMEKFINEKIQVAKSAHDHDIATVLHDIKQINDKIDRCCGDLNNDDDQNGPEPTDPEPNPVEPDQNPEHPSIPKKELFDDTDIK